LGIQVTKWNCFKHHREWIHCSQHGHLRVEPFHWLLQEIHHLGFMTLPSDVIYNITRTPTLSSTNIFEDKAACIVLGKKSTWNTLV
jgi:hypothetical protein